MTPHDILFPPIPNPSGPSQRGTFCMFDVRQTATTFALIAALGVTIAAQEAIAPLPSQTPSDKNQGTTPKEFKPLKYRLIGPAAGGRVARVAGVAGDAAT